MECRWLLWALVLGLAAGCAARPGTSGYDFEGFESADKGDELSDGPVLEGMVLPSPDAVAAHDGYLWVNYVRVHEERLTVYSGRTGGDVEQGENLVEAALEAIHRRYGTDSRPDHLDGIPVNVVLQEEEAGASPNRRSVAYAAHRGGEQFLINYWGGAQSDVREDVRGTSDNRVRGIGLRNSRRDLYLDAATDRGWWLPDRHGEELHWSTAFEPELESPAASAP